MNTGAAIETATTIFTVAVGAFIILVAIIAILWPERVE